MKDYFIVTRIGSLGTWQQRSNWFQLQNFHNSMLRHLSACRLLMSGFIWLLISHEISGYAGMIKFN